MGGKGCLSSVCDVEDGNCSVCLAHQHDEKVQREVLCVPAEVSHLQNERQARNGNER